ncbi:membrane protein [Bacteroidia bacterium]|nr:membrane protein [Bacteroidia bacterium]
MKIAVENTFHRIAACLLLISIPIILQADDGNILNRKVKITKSKETVYQLLKQISDQTGYLFIYDSQQINNDKVVKIRKGEYTIREAIHTIIGNNKLEITVIRNHILLKIPSDISSNITVATKDTIASTNNLITLGGVVYDKINNEPIAYCAIGVNNSTIGTITNQNGEFRLTLADSLAKSTIKLSHIGYLNEEIEISLLAGQTVRISLEPKVVPLQEIIVRAVNPLEVLRNMMANRKDNYPSLPAYITTFYREGVEHKKKVISLTEAILKIYKTGYQNDAGADQVKLVKMRNIINKQESDTIFTKMKSGINACLLLDVMKVLPDFLIEQSKEESPYIYTHTDISVVDNRRVNVISFEQKKGIELPLYRGDLFIDAENQALLEARFEVNPKYVAKATPQYVERKAKNINLTLQKAQYTVSYKPSIDGIYYVNHIRGDIEFKVKRKRRLFATTLHLWFEMVSCEISTENVKSFARSERLSPHNIFSDTNYSYDPDFWKNFNIILPEDKLEDMIINSINRVVESQIKN